MMQLAPIALEALAGFAVGLLLGLIHFRSLLQVSGDYLQGRAMRAALLQLARMTVLAAALYVMARVGAGCLLGGAAGVLVGRRLVMRRVGKEETP
ncbi:MULTISPECIES: ATP synthase subunit I [Novosphingobium]|uniref:N-ATPase, AtpR subunit n=1 Tax=Novosphingobium pentaromativorans US6-1 TaxID=1088721 RepID=G6EHG7_9SPHN|nr:MULTISPECIES: ATP synthase subunit I [Novosphingobium]AIT81880.1 hypothetical protein JI59_20110 [Novosphingobium pentaromativorans US6-1]EHJ59456.1 hypothetical protein NSU_3788 [Novosphingobium pentaromativorans US6-1]BBA74142.1 hypothetical protein [Novosphingobium sp. PY1]GFM31379.1 uncharacterized protein PY1_contig-17-76 [Novosphingobium sp. PY1]